MIQTSTKLTIVISRIFQQKLFDIVPLLSLLGNDLEFFRAHIYITIGSVMPGMDRRNASPFGQLGKHHVHHTRGTSLIPVRS